MHAMTTLLEATEILVRHPLAALGPNPVEVVGIVMVDQCLGEVAAVILERRSVPRRDEMFQAGICS